MNERELFDAAVQIADPAARSDFLENACGDDDQLRKQIEGLLRAEQQLGSFLAAPLDAVARTIDMPPEKAIREAPGTQIGQYKLLEQIGEGGFGVVFMAEQQQPIRRKVALKVLKPGMDTRQVIARFEAERQALALMDHPNIAKVYDAGTTETGRPYFAMELVKGIAITEYCDANRLTPKERLELFLTVCQAIQHAHQKGIIHRDIKPSNVLVSKHDVTSVVKVIDFGVAKAVGQQLTDKTLFTGFAQMIGTPLYMSPEQAEFSGLDVDTRTDIYSLGVLLYELLTGTTPFDKSRLKLAAFDEIRRIIREDEPPKPSTRLSDLNRSELGPSSPGRSGVLNQIGQAKQPPVSSLASIAALRKIDPHKLSSLVRGDLDWIVMKALDKDRNRRYETANGFAADIVHYLNDEPVLACPPSTAYQIKKFVRRNKGTVFSGALLLTALLFGITGTTLGLLQANTQRDKALAAEIKERQAFIEAEENLQTARNAVDRMYTRAAEEMRDKPQVEQIRRALLEDALRFYRGFLQRKSDDLAILYESALSHRRVGEIHGSLGEMHESLNHHRQATEMLIAMSPHYAKDAGFQDQLALAHFHTGSTLLSLLKFEEGAASINQAMAVWEKLTIEFRDRPSYLEELARAKIVLGQAWTQIYHEDGNRYIAQGQDLLSTLKQRFPAHELSGSFKADLKALPGWRYRFLSHDPANLHRLEQECRDRLAIAEAEALQYPDTVNYQTEITDWLHRLGTVLTALNRTEEVEQIRRRTLEILQRFASQYPSLPALRSGVSWNHFMLGEILYDTDRPDEAHQHFRMAIRMMDDLARQHPENIRFLNHAGFMLRACPIPRLRDPLRALAISLRVKEHCDVGWEDVVLAQVDAGQYQEALEACEKAGTSGQQLPIFAAYATAICYWHLGRHSEARDQLQQFILQVWTEPNGFWHEPEIRRRARDAAKLMGLEFEHSNSVDLEKVLRNGISLYRKLATEQPGDQGILKELDRCYTELSVLLNRDGRAAEAEGLLLQAVEAITGLAANYPQNLEYHLVLSRFYDQMARVLVKKGMDADGVVEWDKAAAEHTKAIALKSDDWQPWSGRAFIHFHRRQYEAAIADFTRAIHLVPEMHTNWWHRAHCYINLAQWDQAAADFSHVVEHWPDESEGWFLRGFALAQLDQPDKALADFRQAVAKGFKNIEVMQNDSRLNSLRTREDFTDLLKALKQQEKSQGK